MTRNYYANFDAYEFTFITGGLAEEETQISVWGKDLAGRELPAQRLVSDELVGSDLGPQGETGPQG